MRSGPTRRTQFERVVERHGLRFIKLKSGRWLSFFNALDEAENADTALSTAVWRMFKLVGKNEYDLERLDWFIENLEDYARSLRAEIDKLRGVKSKEERIALLRNVSGRSPEEAAEFLRKADELERRLQEAR